MYNPNIQQYKIAIGITPCQKSRSSNEMISEMFNSWRIICNDVYYVYLIFD